MFNGKTTDDPNPFAFAVQTARPAGRRSLVSALKFLLVVAIAFSAVLLVGNQSRRWLVQRLTHDFEELSSAEKQSRLSQLHALGTPAIGPLVGALCDSDESVARTAYELLRVKLSDWALLDRDDATSNHAAMVSAMYPIAGQISDDRTTWTTSLLQQSIALSVNQRDDASQRLYASATNMLDRMSLSERSGPSILVSHADDAVSPRRLTLHAQPLPVLPSDSTEEWTDWPPTESQAPTVYRSSAGKLQPITAHDDVQLGDVHHHEASVDSARFATVPKQEIVAKPATSPAPAQDDWAHPGGASVDQPQVRPVGMIVDSPLETYDTKSVVYWLGSSHQPLRASAKAELARRGLSEREISIATRIAAGDVQTKLDLVDDIARSGSTDPRPWLLLLLSDPSRDVKLKTVSVLATINDPAVERHLRNHILDEPDPTVAFRIRRLLDLR
tara:strand:+ start:97040 stop:98371 length:1332 start_codon:yes stop_codon:yes gene_type:complete